MSFQETDKEDPNCWYTDFGLKKLDQYQRLVLRIKEFFGQTIDTSNPFSLPEAEEFIKNTGAKINYLYSHRFYVKPNLESNIFSIFPTSWDWEVHAPLPSLFNNDEYTNRKYFYYAMFHELTHWTGARNRCNRRNLFKDDAKLSYAVEEVIATLGTIHFLKKYKLWDEDIETRAMLYIEGYMTTIVNGLVSRKLLDYVEGWKVNDYYQTQNFNEFMIKMEAHAALSSAYLHSLQK